VLELSGTPAADAAKQAEDVIAFETAWPRPRCPRELSRDAELFYNPVTLAEADKLTPNFAGPSSSSRRAWPQPKFSLAIPAFFAEVSKMLGDTDPAAWRAYLRFHAVDGASPYLSQPFVQENFGSTARPSTARRKSSRAGSACWTPSTGIGEALGQLYVKAPSRRSQGPMGSW
jgi:putative endopeptidase